MSMTTLLTLASMFGSLSTITPPISYTTKLDIWMVGCIVFVFATLAEFTIVVFLKYYLADITVYYIGQTQEEAVANAGAGEGQGNDRSITGQPAPPAMRSALRAWGATPMAAPALLAAGVRPQPTVISPAGVKRAGAFYEGNGVGHHHHVSQHV